MQMLPEGVAKKHQSPQLLKLSKLLACQKANQFYKHIAKQLVGSKELASLEQFIASVPFTVKEQLIENQLSYPPYGNNLAYPLLSYTRLHQTSGTTAAPLRWLDTPESWQAILICWHLIYHAAGVTKQDRVCFMFSFAPFLGFWSAFEAAVQYGCMAIPTGNMSSKARIQLIMDCQPTVLCCTPSYALHLAEIAKQSRVNIKDSSIQRIIVAGEAGGSLPATRSLIESSWNARVYDHHGMTETGPITYPCPLIKDQLHVLEQSFFAEVINPETTDPVLDDQEGELVVTTLDRCGSPLLRYRTGDLVRPRHGQCQCGSHDLTLVGGIHARRDDMWIVRGVNVYPSVIEELIRRLASGSEYRVIVDQRSILTELRLQIELVKDDQVDTILSRIRHDLTLALGLRIEIEAIPLGSLYRQDMKAKRWQLLTAD